MKWAGTKLIIFKKHILWACIKEHKFVNFDLTKNLNILKIVFIFTHPVIGFWSRYIRGTFKYCVSKFSIFIFWVVFILAGVCWTVFVPNRIDLSELSDPSELPATIRQKKNRNYQDPPGPTWTILVQSGSTRTYLDLPGPTWTHQELPGPKKTYLDLSGPTWTYQDLPGPIRTYLDPSGPTWTHQDIPGPKKTYLDLSGPTWT